MWWFFPGKGRVKFDVFINKCPASHGLEEEALWKGEEKNVFCEFSLFCCLSDHNDLGAVCAHREDLLLSTAKIVNYNHKSMHSPFNSAHTSLAILLNIKRNIAPLCRTQKCTFKRKRMVKVTDKKWSWRDSAKIFFAF